MTSYWHIARLIFVIFSFYLVGDVLYRWDGFKYYASFSEFIPAVALISILWGIMAFITAFILRLAFNLAELLAKLTRSLIKADSIKILMCLFMLLSFATIHSKRFLFGGSSSFQLKLAVVFFVIFATALITWLIRKKVDHINIYVSFVQDKITPLVWIFGIIVTISIPLVTYHTWIKPPDSHASKMSIQKTTSKAVKRPNILLVTFDALTAENMSAYGYERITTPFIDKWAKKAYLFGRAEAESNYTTPTAASLMTGKRLWTHQMYHPKGAKPVNIDTENLPLTLKNNGYFNIALIANTYASVNTLGVANSFDIAPSIKEFHLSAFQSTVGFEYIGKTLHNLFSERIRLHDWLIKEDFIFHKTLVYFMMDYSSTRMPVELAFNRFLNILENNPPEPYFAWIHVLPPHDPYLPPEPYMGVFNQSSKLGTSKSQQQTQWSDVKTINTFKDRYDEFIRYCDSKFEHFITELQNSNSNNNQIIILSSDHGESFEKRYHGHGGRHLYEQVTHIPLIIKQPGQSQGRLIDEMVEQIDIPATILDLAGISVPSWMEGQSIVPLLRGETYSRGPLFSMYLEQNRSHHLIEKGTFTLWEGNYKLIYYLKEGKALLFNLDRDPKEMENLFDKEPEIGQRLLAIIQNNLNQANEKINKGNW